MNDLIWILLFYLGGLAAMVIELFIPGAVMGIIGFLTVCGTIIYAFMSQHNTTGMILLACTIMFIPVFFLMWKNVLGRFFAVTDNEGTFRSSMGNYEDLRGKEGVTASPLRPSGTAVIEGERYAVVTRGKMVDKGVRVKVVDVAGSRLTVKEVE